MLAYAIFQPACNWLVPVVTRFKTARKEVWLTIDDGPDGTNTEQLIEILARHNARATFFVKGQYLLKHARLAGPLLAAGHTLANHTHTHPAALFWCYPPRYIRSEIASCNDALKQTTGLQPNWFRSPVGIKSLFLQPILANHGMRLIAWSLKGKDGIVCNPIAVAKRIKSLVRPGDIILLHEGRLDSNKQASSNECIGLVVEELAQMGYSFVVPTDEQLC